MRHTTVRGIANSALFDSTIHQMWLLWAWRTVCHSERSEESRRLGGPSAGTAGAPPIQSV